MNNWEEERIKEILLKIKKTVGENNYKLALAITGHKPGKIRDVLMSSKDGELLLKYITKLENNWNELKEDITHILEMIEHNKDIIKVTSDEELAIYSLQEKMQEIEKVENEK